MNITNSPNDVFKPDLKTLLAERQQLDDRRKASKSFFERMKLSSQISALDRKITSYDLRTK